MIRSTATAASRDLYQALASQTVYGVLLVDPTGRIAAANPRCDEVLGCAPESVVGRPVADLIGGMDPAGVSPALAALRSREPVWTECLLHAGDRGPAAAEFSGWVLPDGSVLGLLRDLIRELPREFPPSQATDELDEVAHVEAELRRVMASVSDYLWSADVDPDGTWTYQYYSPVVEDITGWPPAYFLESPQRWLESVHQDDRARVLEAFHRLAGGTSDREQDEYRVVRPDGTVRWVRDTVTVTTTAHGHRRVDGVVQDITDSKRAEEAQQTHVWFLSALDRINRAMQGTNELQEMAGAVLEVVLSIFDCDRAWLCYPFERRPSWLSLIERTRPEYPGGLALGIDELMNADVIDVFEKVRAAGRPLVSGPEGELRLPAEDRARYRVESQIAMAIHPKAGAPWIFGLHQCSHARVWTSAEKQLFQEVGSRLADALTSLVVHWDLRQSERKLEKAGNMARLGWWERDYETGFVLLSEAARETFGLDRHRYTLDEWQALWESLIHPEDRAHIVGAVNQAIQGGARYDVAYRAIRPDGELRFIRSEADVTADAPGKPRRVFGIVQDITERKELEAANERLAEQFHQAQKMESIGRLAGGIAHDFNNLLVPIIGYIDLNLESLEQDSPLYRDLTQVRRAAERAADLTRQILAFSRRQVLELRALDLNAVIRGFLPMLQRLIGEDLTLQTFLHAGLDPVAADQGQVEQILLNLAVNSRDAMPAGGRLTVETAGVYLDDEYVEKHARDLAPGRYVMLAVSDTGQGMDAETRARVFDPFFTTKGRGKGTGLGLATVYGIVKQHQGHIGLYTEVDHGTTFKIYLPSAEGVAGPVATPAVEPVSLGGTETVLVAEDEEMVRQLVCETLSAHGYDVLEAANAAEGLELAAGRDTVHLLLTDVIMPECNGMELHERLAARHPACRALFMSGYTHNVIVHHGILKPGINFLHKPFTIRDLARRVREVLDV